jgi:hypothetical protein
MKRRNRISGQWSARLIEMLQSPAYRALSLSAHRLISRIEIELANHGGNDNGRLPVTKQDFIDYGISVNQIAPAKREAEALGFIRETVHGSGGNSEHRQSSSFLLTFAHGRDSRSDPPTHDWRKIKTIGEAETIGATARNAKDPKSVAFGHRSWRIRSRRNRYQKPIPKPVSETNTETAKSPVSETNTTGSGRKLIPLSISRGGGGGSGGFYEEARQPSPRRQRRICDETRQQLKPWTTPRLVEIKVTPGERAELERLPVYVAPGDVGVLVPEDSDRWQSPYTVAVDE